MDLHFHNIRSSNHCCPNIILVLEKLLFYLLFFFSQLSFHVDVGFDLHLVVQHVVEGIVNRATHLRSTFTNSLDEKEVSLVVKNVQFAIKHSAIFCGYSQNLVDVFSLYLLGSWWAIGKRANVFLKFLGWGWGLLCWLTRNWLHENRLLNQVKYFKRCIIDKVCRRKNKDYDTGSS